MAEAVYVMHTANGGKIRLINGNCYEEPFVVYMPFKYICTDGTVRRSPFVYAVADDWSRRRDWGRLVKLYSDSNTIWMTCHIRSDRMILLYKGLDLVGTVCR